MDGANISADDLIEATLLVKEQAEAMADHPTEFELMCAVALVHFARSGCDVVVLEVGLGGRLDSTNVIDAPRGCRHRAHRTRPHGTARQHASGHRGREGGHREAGFGCGVVAPGARGDGGRSRQRLRRRAMR